MAQFKYISQNFKNLEQAESFQEGLYEKYDHVRLVSSPTFHPAGAGRYQWEVKSHKGE